jgi:hypothetical protein
MIDAQPTVSGEVSVSVSMLSAASVVSYEEEEKESLHFISFQFTNFSNEMTSLGIFFV